MPYFTVDYEKSIDYRFIIHRLIINLHNYLDSLFVFNDIVAYNKSDLGGAIDEETLLVKYYSSNDSFTVKLSPRTND